MATKLKYEIQVQWFEGFAFNIEKLSILTIILLPKYTLFFVPALILSTFLYQTSSRLREKHDLTSYEQEKYYLCMFQTERFMIFLLVVSDYFTWGILIWGVAFGFFAHITVIHISKQENLFNKLFTSRINNPRLNPSQENGYVFWIVRTTAITVGIVPFNCLIKCFHYFALGLFLVPAIGYYIFKPENITPTVNSRDAKELLSKSARSSDSGNMWPKIDKFISLLESHLFWLERVAIYCSIVYSSKRPMIFAMTNALFMLFSFPTNNLCPSEPDYLFWIERAATVFLVAYGFDESGFNWLIASSLFALTNIVYFSNPMINLLDNLKPHFDNVRLFDGYDEDLEIESPMDILKSEIKRLKSKNNDLQKEKVLHARELSKSIKESKEIKRLMKEREDHWDEINNSLRSDINDLNREKLGWAQELDNAIKESEESSKMRHKKLMSERESFWERRVCAEMKDLERGLENAMLASEESHRADILKYQKQSFRAETRVSELMVKLEEANSRTKALRSEFNLLDSVWLRDQALISRLKEDNERLEAKVAELAAAIEESDSLSGLLSEEYKRVEKRCEIYKCLLHDHDCDQVVVKGVVDG